MSKSLKRVRAALEGEDTEIRETGEAKTAIQAAGELGVDVDQIAKSIIFQGQTSGAALLFITAGGNHVCETKATALAGEPLVRADAAVVRAQTGFAIGGVSPIAHKTPIRSFFDTRLHDFGLVWAAAGTPHHVFSMKPARLLERSGAQAADFKSETKICKKD